MRVYLAGADEYLEGNWKEECEHIIDTYDYEAEVCSDVREADVMLVNLTEMDAKAGFEVGMAIALGIPAIGFGAGALEEICDCTFEEVEDALMYVLERYC